MVKTDSPSEGRVLLLKKSIRCSNSIKNYLLEKNIYLPRSSISNSNRTPSSVEKFMNQPEKGRFPPSLICCKNNSNDLVKVVHFCINIIPKARSGSDLSRCPV